MTETATQIERKPKYDGVQATIEEYYRLKEDTEFRYELVDGRMIVVPSASFDHQLLLVELAHLIRAFLHTKPLGRIVVETDVELSKNIRKPELTFIRKENLHIVKNNRIRGAPDLVVEILSEESYKRDTETKFEEYESDGIKEYWIVSPDLSEAHFYALHEGSYEEIPVESDCVISEVLDGFVLDVNELKRRVSI